MTIQVQEGLGGRSLGHRPVFAIFEGGGAKGITHVGALKALERENLALVGVAGSSAGAIIAALAAVGYSADELFAEDGSRDILSDLKLGPLDLLGRKEWVRLAKMRPRLWRTLVKLGLAIVLALASALWLWSAWSFIPLILLAAFSIFFLSALVPVTWGARRILRDRGLLSTERVRQTLNELLRKKLERLYKAQGLMTKRAPKSVRFKHIDPTKITGCCRLKIAVSDSRSGKLVLFDHNDENVVVADAVAASAAIPFAFVPPDVEGMADDSEPVLVDGGLVSNLPAWSFREEKRALEREQGGPPIPIIAFTLVDEVQAPAEDPAKIRGRARRLWRFTADVLRTGIFGSQAIVQAFISDLFVIELPSPLGTFSFSCSRDEAIAAYKAGLEVAERELRQRRLIAEITVLALESFLREVRQEIAERRAAANRKVPNLRACLIDPIEGRGEIGSAIALRVTASANMDSDADDRLELDLSNEVAPRAFVERAPIYSEVKGRSAQQLRMTKYERALVRKDLCSIICVPVFARETRGGAAKPPPQRVLCLDSSDILKGEFNDSKFMAKLTAASVMMSRTLIEEIIEGTSQ